MGPAERAGIDFKRSGVQTEPADNRGLGNQSRKFLKVIVKKTFKLNIEGKNRDRVLEATKHEISKYVKRQRRVPLPEGVDFWDFDCKFGTTEENAVVIHFATITEMIDAVANEGGEQFYLEMLAKTGHRTARPAGADVLQQGLD